METTPRKRIQKPRRAIQVDISIGGDTWQDVLTELKHIAEESIRREQVTPGVMGGSTSGSIRSVSLRDITHDQYITELEAYVNRKG
jgi:hypothetical protein